MCEPFRIHLFLIGEDEAQAAIDANGYPETCSWQGCGRAPVAMALLRRDLAVGWGSINAMGLCDEHEAEFMRLETEACEGL